MVRSVGEDESEQKVIDDVAKFCWHCVHIVVDGDRPEYSYTVGLSQTYKFPELVIFGLPCKVSHQILGIAADAVRHPLDLTQPTTALINNYSCCLAEVPSSQYDEHVGFCRWYYRGNCFPLYQIIWPSRTGLFPWHPQAMPAFRATQPVIAITAGGT